MKEVSPDINIVLLHSLSSTCVCVVLKTFLYVPFNSSTGDVLLSAEAKIVNDFADIFASSLHTIFF
jgi:hypothetical protein